MKRLRVGTLPDPAGARSSALLLRYQEVAFWESDTRIVLALTEMLKGIPARLPLPLDLAVRLPAAT
ncbi:hypothetical protein KDAU_56440 [Dictyobacter aurantiacus]|uniref:Uncharacterized protein n=1 Tax=Dictyobacter aurantiacus TaxID=1936993 RepID=A0A401ZN77_9CHLR|nr:hypothetical protein KDAU_56440 [Dictyobacter aurantiacus]